MAISESVLDIISGKAMVDTSNQLLDNTLATINMNMKKREQQQLSTMRNQQIQQASMELAELEKGAYTRKLQRQIAEREAAHTLENFDQNKAMQQDMAEYQHIAAKGQAADEVFDRILQAPDDASMKMLLDQEGHILPEEMQTALRNTNRDNPAEWKKIQDRAILDREYLQKLSLERMKAAGAASKGKVTNIGFASNQSMLKAIKDNYGLGEKEANSVLEVSSDIMKAYGDQGFRKHGVAVAEAVAATLAQNPDRYIVDNPGIFTGDSLNMEQLRIDTMANLEGGAKSISPTDEDKPWSLYGYSDEEWEMFVNKNSSYSEQELLDHLAKTR